MKIKLTILTVLLAYTMAIQAQDKPAYRVFTGSGKKAAYHDILRDAAKADVIFFGELHDNPVAHWLELELSTDLFAEKGKNLVLAAEMFETDNQLVIDEYFSDLIKEGSFEKEVKLWKNYHTDYKPLVSFAKQNGLRFIGSNVPRRYAAVVSSGGFEALQKLSPEAQKFLPPLPVQYDPELPCYKDMLSMNGTIGGSMEGKVNPNLPMAQALKDATMAWSIFSSRQKGQSLIHFNGSYHSDRHMGIIWYLNNYDPGVKIITVTTVTQDDISSLGDESRELADYVIVVPSSMTKTYK